MRSPDTACSPEICYLFAGPSWYAFRRQPITIPTDVRLKPPARFGDVAIRIATGPPAAIALADCTRYPDVPVGYAELRAALESGWSVWGVSAAGAVRAVEMRPFGMQGFGQVYEIYARDPATPEDRVALLAGPPPEYSADSEPMVHLDAALIALEEQGLLPAAVCQTVSATLRSEWFGRRTRHRFLQLLTAAAPPDTRTAVAAFLEDFDRFRLQTLDLEAFLRTAPWRAAGAPSSTP